MWKSDWSVKFNIPVEVTDYLTSSTKSSDFIIPTYAVKASYSEASTKASSQQSTASKDFSTPSEKEEIPNKSTDSSTI